MLKFLRCFFVCLFIMLPLFIKAQEAINEFEELANGYMNQGKPTQAAEFYSKAAYAYWNRGNNKHAAIAFQKAYDLFSNQGNSFASITVGNNLGIIYLDDNKFQEAYTAFSHVLTFARASKNINDTYNALVNLGTIAIELNTYNDAIAKTTEALTLAKELNNLKYIAKCYSIMAEGYEKNGDGSNAYKYFELYSAIDQKIKKQELEHVKEMSAEEINQAHENKRVTEIELKIKKGELKLTQDSLTVSERLAYERQMQVEVRNGQLKKKDIQLRLEHQIRRNLIYGITIAILFLLILGLMLRQKLKDNKTLRLQKDEITGQRNKLDEQNKKITDSIHYGLRIQQAMLPDIKDIEKSFELFVVYKPKDIVSGDFYWFYETKVNDSIYRFVAIVDCTGHGVPGAFMSMIGHRLLTEIIIERKIYQPSQALELININLQKELSQDNKKSMDGMDIGLCRFEVKNGLCEELIFAGAKRPLLIFTKEDDKLSLIDADRKGIGGFFSGEQKTFTDKAFKLHKGDMVFMYTDGLIDQQNIERKRFGTTRFTSIINDNRNESMVKIKIAIEKALEKYGRSKSAQFLWDEFFKKYPSKTVIIKN